MADISVYDQRAMLRALEIMPRYKTFLRDMFFKNVQLFNAPNVDIDIRSRQYTTALYTSPNGEPHVSKRTGFVTKTYKPPYIKESRILSASDVMGVRGFGETPYNYSSNSARAMELVRQDLIDCDKSIGIAEEVQAAQIMFTGAVTFPSETSVVAFDGIDFGMKATHQVDTMSTYWNESGSDPLKDLRDWRELISADSGVYPNVMILGKNAYEALRGNSKLIDSQKISSIGADYGMMTIKEVQDQVTYYGRLMDAGCDMYGYGATYIEPKTGAVTPFVPDDYILLANTNARMDRCYGAIQRLDAMYPVDRFVSVHEDARNSKREMIMESAPLLIPHEIDTYLYAKVYTS